MKQATDGIFRAIFEKASIPMLMLDDSAHFIDCNDAAISLLGVGHRDMIVGHTPSDLSPEFQSDGEPSVAKALRMLKNAYDQGNTRFEWIHSRADGTSIDMEVNLTVITVDSRSVVLAHWRDITAQKKIERSQSALYRISEAAQNAETLHQLLTSIHSIISALMPANNFYISMLDQSTGELTFPFHMDESDSEWGPIIPGKSITGYVFRTGQSLLATPEIFKALIDSGEVELLGSQSVDWLGVPLKTKTDEIIGVMALQTYNPSIRLTHADQEILEFVSRQVADAIQRKQMEENVRESERRYEGLFNSVKDAIYIQNKDGTFIDVNHSVELMYGYSKSEIIGKTPEFLAAPGKNDLAEIIAKIRSTDETGISHSFEFWGRRKNGEIFPKEVTVSKGQYFDNEVIIAIARDVTDRKRTEEEIRLVNLQYADLLETLKEGVYKSTSDGRFVEVNNGLVKMLGYDSKEELMAINIATDLYFDPDDRNFVTQQELLGNTVVYRLKRKDGSEIWVEDQGRYIFDEKGKILFHEGIVRDVSRRKYAEDELRIASTVFQAVSEAIVVTDASNSIVAINPAFTKLTGYTKEEVIGKNPSFFKSGKHGPEFYQEMWDSIKKYGTWQGEIINKRKNGDLYDEWLSISTIHNEQGKVLQRVALFSDITEQKKLRAHLLQTQKMESLGTLAGGIAHDFNNLLAILLGSAELLKRRLVHDPKLSVYLDQIIDASHRGESISRQLLFFSRQSEVVLEPISLTTIIEEVKTMLRHFIPKTISINTEIKVRNGIIHGDSGHLHQMILNLCLNAKDAIGQHGAITIREYNVDADVIRKIFSSNAEGEFVAVDVSDDGVGIDPAIISKIFDPFFTTKEKGKGTGLGLAIVSGLMQSHHGHIDVRSTPGKGATFTLYFPAAKKGTEIPTLTESNYLFRGETILLVDDEETLRSSLRGLLEISGCTVLQASDGFEALTVFEQHQSEIDAVITDLGMPNMNGEEMYKKLKQMDPEVKVIISSGYLDGAIRSQLIASGICDVISKPYRFSEISRVLSNVLYSKP